MGEGGGVAGPTRPAPLGVERWGSPTCGPSTVLTPVHSARAFGAPGPTVGRGQAARLRLCCGCHFGASGPCVFCNRRCLVPKQRQQGALHAGRRVSGCGARKASRAECRRPDRPLCEVGSGTHAKDSL